MKKYNFPHTSITMWNELIDKTKYGKIILKFKENLDQGQYVDNTS